MSKEEYKSLNVQNFINAFNDFNNEFETYQNSILNFNTQIESLVISQENSNEQDEIIIKNQINNQFYLLTKEDLLFNSPQQKNKNIDHTINIQIKPYKLNKIIFPSKQEVGSEESYRNAYYIPLSSSVYKKQNKKSNTIAQIGLEDLRFNDEDNGLIKKMKQSVNPSIENNGLCNIKDVYKCDSYSKMTNTKYYGLNYKDSTDKCGCYMFDNLNSLDDMNKEYILKTKNINYSKMNDIHYFGVLYDGNLYGLKQKKYKNNFKDLYFNDKNLNKIIYTENNCNPFTGYGIFNVNVNSFDSDRDCKLK